MRYIIVRIWGIELGRLAYNPHSRQCHFVFNPELKEKRPDVSPLLAPLSSWQTCQTMLGDERRLYQNLPPFIADSLPDAWGNKLFEQWVKRNKLASRDITPLYKLMFIGKRGMGALEFEPVAKDLEHPNPVDVESLYKLSLRIANEREETSILPDEELTMQTLLSVGTSAGGRQTKAIIAINNNTGEIRSGQTGGLDGFDYYLLKFEDDVVPTSEIEMAYYEMAVTAGIGMAECRLLKIGGCNHFLTRRFDRKNDEKVHMQTLAAINPEVTSYEDLFNTCRQLGLTEQDIEQIYRRLVFNVLGNNTDDHNKNFSFLLERDGRWELSPAYDMTFIFNRYGSGAETDRCLSVAGKYRDITRSDLIEVARENGVRNPEGILDQISGALFLFAELSHKYAIDGRWSNIIKTTLLRRLTEFGYATDIYVPESKLEDSYGRIFTNIRVNLNIKGHYEVSVMLNDAPRRRFVRPNMPQYAALRDRLFQEMTNDEQLTLLAGLFPV